MSKKSKQVENRIRSSQHVVTAATTHREQIADILAKRAIEVQGASTPVTKTVILSVIDFLADDLKHSFTNMDGAEMGVVAERADDVGLRDARDEATSNLLNAAVRTRSMVSDALGDKGLATYGLAGETPRAARDLVTHADTVSKLMQQQPFNVTIGGVTFDSAAMAATLISKKDVMEKAINDMLREEQELVNQLGKRHEAITEWTDVHQGVADTLMGLFRLAGRKDLADRVRPTSRTLSGEDVPSEEPTPATGNAPPGGAPPAAGNGP